MSANIPTYPSISSFRPNPHPQPCDMEYLVRIDYPASVPYRGQAAFAITIPYGAHHLVAMFSRHAIQIGNVHNPYIPKCHPSNHNDAIRRQCKLRSAKCDSYARPFGSSNQKQKYIGIGNPDELRNSEVNSGGPS